MLPISLAVLMAVSPAQPVTIYVGPNVRQGFVDADEGITRSIEDLRKELRKNRALRVVVDESSAMLKLYVVARSKVSTGDTVVTGTGSSTTKGGAHSGSATAVTVPVMANRVETLLRVGEYERPLVGESDWVVGAWKRCASSIAKDLQAWLVANQERIAVLPAATQQTEPRP